MNHLGDIHIWIEKDVPEYEVLKKVEAFINEIKNKPAYNVI